MHAFHRTIIATILMLALQLVALSSWAFAQVPFDVPGAVHTVAFGVNDAGAVVGRYTDSSGRDHGFLWQGGSSGTVHSFIIP
jgi:probable HAF family extracellular repeat protein